MMMVNGWIITQQRIYLNVSFNVNWYNYTNGFGSLDGDYWMGNELVYQLIYWSVLQATHGDALHYRRYWQ